MECKNFLSLFKRLLQEWADKGKSLEMPLQEWLKKDKKYKAAKEDKNESSSEPSSSKQEREMLVFDFDTVMKNFCAKINILTLSSVDGLYLDEKQNIIYLLEMKSVDSHLKDYSESTSESTMSPEERLESMSPEERFESIKKFLLEGEDDLSDSDSELKNDKKKKKRSTLADKVGNSYTSFFAMFGYGAEGVALNSSDNLPLVRCLLDKKQFKICYVIVVDIQSEDWVKWKLSLLSDLKRGIAHGFLGSDIQLRTVDKIYEISENASSSVDQNH